MLTIGLTGNISSGKSTVSRYLASLGATIIDADEVSREIVRPGAPALREIVDYFGAGVLAPDGSLDRKGLGALVFGDPEALAVLNNLTHPRIVAVIEEAKKRNAATPQSGLNLLVIDAPLLIETGLHQTVDAVWVVTVEPETQKQRLMQRDGISAAAALSRIKAQMPQEEKIKYAQALIDNNGDPTETIRQVKQLLEKLAI